MLHVVPHGSLFHAPLAALTLAQEELRRAGAPPDTWAAHVMTGLS